MTRSLPSCGTRVALSVLALPMMALPALAQDACGRFPTGSDALTCSCTGTESGSVWGSWPYTADSDICAAARHAGVVGEMGGVVTALAAPGEASYTGTEQNGVTTRDWGSYGASFVFDAPIAAADVCVPFPEELEVYDCYCSGSEAGPVTGSGPYAMDSDICAAALHAGVILPDGGWVTAVRTAGVYYYAGSDFGGVLSQSREGDGASFTFDLNMMFGE